MASGPSSTRLALRYFDLSKQISAQENRETHGHIRPPWIACQTKESHVLEKSENYKYQVVTQLM